MKNRLGIGDGTVRPDWNLSFQRNKSPTEVESAARPNRAASQRLGQRKNVDLDVCMRGGGGDRGTQMGIGPPHPWDMEGGAMDSHGAPPQGGSH